MEGSNGDVPTVLAPHIRSLGRRHKRRLLPLRAASRRRRADGARSGSRAARLDPTTVPKFQTPLLIPPVMPRAGTIKQPGGKSVDYYEISMKQITQQVLPAGLPATTVWGYGAKASAEQARPAHSQRPLAHDRGKLEPARPGEVDQRARGRQRQLPAAPAARRPDPALGEPARRHRRSRQPADVHRDAWPLHGPRPDRHPRARRRRRGRRQRRLRGGLVPASPRTTSRRAMPRKGRGTTSSPARPRRPTASRGDPASPPSSTRTTTGRRRSGTTTTRSG